LTANHIKQSVSCDTTVKMSPHAAVKMTRLGTSSLLPLQPHPEDENKDKWKKALRETQTVLAGCM